MPWFPTLGEEDKRTARGDQVRLRQGKTKLNRGEAKRTDITGHKGSIVSESCQGKDTFIGSDRLGKTKHPGL